MCSIPIVAPQAVCSSRTDRWLSTKQLVVVVYIKMLLLFLWNVFISVCVSTHQLGGAPCGFIHSSMGILFLSAQLLTGHVTAGRRWQHVHTEHMYGMCIEMHSLYTYVARVSIDLECSCRSTHHLNHQPSLWTLLSIFSPPHSLFAEFCVLLVVAPISPLVQRRRSHQLAKIRWPLVFLLSPRTPMLTVGTTRQVQCEIQTNF